MKKLLILTMLLLSSCMGVPASEKTNIRDLAYRISKIFDKKIIIQKTSLKKGGTKIRIPNINKIKKLGFKPKFNLNSGLQSLIDI